MKTENLIMNKSDIIRVRLKKENYDTYSQLLKEFTSRDSSINTVIKKRPDYFRQKGKDYDNRDTIYLYVYEDPSSSERHLIGYISFAASSISAPLEDGVSKITLPSVVVNTFAISSDFTSKTGARIFDGHKDYKCSTYVMMSFLDEMDKLSYSIGLTHLYLFAQQRSKVVDFYVEDCHFSSLRASMRVFGEEPGTHEYTLFHTLDNGKHRIQ